MAEKVIRYKHRSPSVDGEEVIRAELDMFGSGHHRCPAVPSAPLRPPPVRDQTHHGLMDTPLPPPPTSPPPPPSSSPPPIPPQVPDRPAPQPTPARSRGLIPEPPHGHGRRYVDQMVDGDREDFQHAKVMIKEIVLGILDSRVSWSKQKPARQRELISTVVAAYPAFLKYENNWPVFYYCYQSFTRLRNSPPRPKNVSVAAEDASPATYAPRSQRRVRTHTDYPSSSNQPEQTRFSTPRTPSTPLRPPQAVQPRSASPAYSDTSTAYSPPTQPTGTSQAQHAKSQSRGPQSSQSQPGSRPQPQTATSGEQEVLDFLLLIDGTFASLLSRFVSAGIDSEVRLASLGQWTAAERDVFLRCDVRLSPFETRVVLGGLERLYVAQTRKTSTSG